MSAASIEFNVKDFQGLMASQVTRQVEFASIQTTTNVAFDVMKEVKRKLPIWVKIKKRFLQSSVVVDKATFKNTTAQVGFLQRVELAELLEEGGTRRPARSRVIAIPVGALNKRGVVTKAKRPQALLARSDTFSGELRGVSGIWQTKNARGGKKITLMYRYEDATRYDGRNIRFFETLKRVVPKAFKNRFKINVKRAFAQTKRKRFG